MSSPIVPTGAKVIAAFVKNTNIPWGAGQAIQAGAGDGFEFDKETITPNSEYIENMQVGSGSVTQLPGVKGNELHDGTIELDTYYQGCETLVARVFGTAVAPATTGGSATVYKHVYKVAQDRNGVFGTLVMADQTNLTIREWPYVKIDSFDMTWEDGKQGKATFDVIPFRMNLNEGTASTNNVSTAALPATGNLTLTASPYTPSVPSQITFTLTHTSDTITALTVTVSGTDSDGVAQVVTYTNPVLSAGPLTYTTLQYWATIQTINISVLTGTATGSTLAVGTNPGVNNSTTVTGITLPSSRVFVLFSEMHVWVNGQSATGLTGTPGASDELYVKAFNLKAELNMLKNNVTTKFSKRIEEPQLNGFLQFTGKLSFAEWSSDNHSSSQPVLRDMLAKNLKKMRVQFLGPVADGTVNPPVYYEWDFYLNNCAFTKGAPTVPGPGVIPWDVEFKAQRALSLPTGFPSGYLDACTMEMYNLRSSAAM